MRISVVQNTRFLCLLCLLGWMRAWGGESSIPPELQLVQEQVLPEITKNLKLCFYTDIKASVDSVPLWFIPIGNYNEAPSSRNHSWSIQYQSEGGLFFLDDTDTEWYRGNPAFCQIPNAIDLYRSGATRVVLVPARNPEQDVWSEFAAQIVEKRKALSPAPSFDKNPIVFWKRFEEQFPKTDERAFVAFGEKFRDAFVGELSGNDFFIGSIRPFHNGNISWRKYDFPEEFRISFPRLAFKVRIGTTTLAEWENPEFQNTTALFWILPVFDPETGRLHEIYQPLWENDNQHVNHCLGYVRIDEKTPPETIAPLIYIGAAQNYRVFLLPYNETNRAVWNHLADVARKVLFQLAAPDEENSSVRHKLENIRVPFAEWSNANIRDVLADLTQFSKDINEGGSNLSRCGIAFNLAKGDEEADELPSVTIKGVDISLGSLLDKIVETTGFAFQIDNDHIILYRRQPSDEEPSGSFF